VVGGLTNALGTPTGGLTRLDSNGDLDTTFANGGSLMSSQIVTGLLIQSDGKMSPSPEAVGIWLWSGIWRINS